MRQIGNLARNVHCESLVKKSDFMAAATESALRRVVMTLLRGILWLPSLFARWVRGELADPRETRKREKQRRKEIRRSLRGLKPATV